MWTVNDRPNKNKPVISELKVDTVILYMIHVPKINLYFQHHTTSINPTYTIPLFFNTTLRLKPRNKPSCYLERQPISGQMPSLINHSDRPYTYGNKIMTT